MNVNPNIRHQSFFGDACATLARNVRDLLGLAGIPVTRQTILQIVSSLPTDPSQFAKDEPWQGLHFNKTMMAVDEKHRGTPRSERARELGHYFLAFAYRDPVERGQLIAAFHGVLSVELEAPCSPG